MRKVNLVFILFIILSLIQCRQAKETDKKQQVDSDKPTATDNIVERRKITFHFRSITKHTISWLKNIKDQDSLNLLLTLNRVDYTHLLRLDSLLIPDKFYPDLRLYAPFPDSIKMLNDIHKLILVSNFLQAFAVYENGLLYKWGPVSTGKMNTPTPTGLFHTNWKSKKAISTIDSTWIMKWYFNLDNFAGISMHEYSLPGYPASHSCIRLLPTDARWLYFWSDEWILKNNSEIAAYGTPLIVFGNYPYTGSKPWHKLAEDNRIKKISTNELDDAITPFITLLLKRQNQREELTALSPKVNP